MKNWLLGLGVVIAILAGLFWWAILDGHAPPQADGALDLAAYRALVASDAPDTLPTEIRVETIGESEVPSFAAEAGAFDGPRTFAYPAFQILAPSGTVILDAAVDAATLNEMSRGEGRFNEEAYSRLIAAMATASQIVVTHEHLDHIIAIARHPAPEAIAPRLRLTEPQLAALPEHAPADGLAPQLANLAPMALVEPTRIAPGIVLVPAAGHSVGSIVIYVRTATQEYLFIGDIVWQMSNIENARGRPRMITWLIEGVDPDRNTVLRQVRALHEIAQSEPDVVIVPAHDANHLAALITRGELVEGFVSSPAQ